MELPFDRDKFILEEWPEALESGEFEQGRGQLRRIFNTGASYCCLGVACALLERRGLINPESWVTEGLLPSNAVHLLGITTSGQLKEQLLVPHDLAECNDDCHENFHEIAARLRAGQLRKIPLEYTDEYGRVINNLTESQKRELSKL